MLDVTKLLTELGIEYKSVGSLNVRIKCINPDHHETKPSMYIHKETGVIHCFGCGFRGNLFTLLGERGIYGMDAFSLLRNFTKGGLTEESIKKSLERFVSNRGTSTGQEGIFVSLPTNVRMPSNNPYLLKRGITEEDTQKWDIRLATERKYSGWVLIPIHQFSVLRTYFLRSVWGDTKLYGFYKNENGEAIGYPRDDILAGIDFAPQLQKKLYITEGIFDAISVSHTKQQCVAALSNRLLPKQVDILKHYDHVVIVPDNDEPGYSLVKSALSLIHTTKVSVCKLPTHKKDAGDSSLEELLESMYKEVPIEQYVIDYAKEKLFKV